jgi:hypothetical protein
VSTVSHAQSLADSRPKFRSRVLAVALVARRLGSG